MYELLRQAASNIKSQTQNTINQQNIINEQQTKQYSSEQENKLLEVIQKIIDDIAIIKQDNEGVSYEKIEKLLKIESELRKIRM